MSRIARQNEKFLARVRESIDFERKCSEDRQQEKVRRELERKQKQDETNRRIAQSNDRYSDLWIATTGISVPQVINVILFGSDGGVLLNRLDIRIYDQLQKALVPMNLLTFIKMLHDTNFPELEISPRGQVTINNIVIPARAYAFIRYHWLACRVNTT